MVAGVPPKEFNWRLWAIIGGVTAFLLAAIVGWLAPTLKKKEHELAVKTEALRVADEQINTLKNRRVEVIKYRDGPITERVVEVEVERTSSESHTTSDERGESRERETVTEKRGQFVVGAGLDHLAHPSILLQATLIGPLGLGGSASFSALPFGIYTGSVYATLAF